MKSVIDVNVGGKIFTFFESCIPANLKQSKQVFSAPNGLFIDMDPQVFHRVSRYLRGEPIGTVSPSDRAAFDALNIPLPTTQGMKHPVAAHARRLLFACSISAELASHVFGHYFVMQRLHH
jgi:hypothetical protein